ncbi:MAG TPA: aldose 1-epimerase family protein [Jiangellaceae bacterium]|nr:aldose 1-epimerase family protein [Jiangellaceae bacterium]
MSISGTQYTISGHGYTARLTEVGATLRSLTYGDRDLIVPFGPDQVRPLHRGAVLAPWPNRIANGTYTFNASTQQLPLTEPSRGNAIHGLVSWVRWECVAQDDDSVTLRHRLVAQTGYPWELELRVTFRLASDGLHWSIHAENPGNTIAPYGTAPHPYLVAGRSALDTWTLSLPAEDYLEVSADRLLPYARTGVGGTKFDFREMRPIGDVEIDHAFTTLAADSGGQAQVELVDAADGTGVALRWDAGVCPWVQIHTADRPEKEDDRLGLAVEPMTCPPDAFNSGTDVVRLRAGAAHDAEWVIAATEA